jgi:hypothetical protein
MRGKGHRTPSSRRDAVSAIYGLTLGFGLLQGLVLGNWRPLIWSVVVPPLLILGKLAVQSPEK